MRVIAIGLAVAALAAAVVAPMAGAHAKTAAKPDKAHEQGMAEAPALLQQSGADCTLTDANYLGSSKAKGPDGKDVTTQIYEAACQEGLGYMILAPENATPNAFDCLALSGNAPKKGEKDTNGLYCRMEANAQPLKGLQAIVAKTGVACTVDQGRWMGAGAEEKFNQYEVSCSEGTAYVVQAPFGGSSHSLNAVDCMRVPSDTCTYFPKAKMVSAIAAMAAPSGRTCTPTDARYVGTLPNKDNFYEIACADGGSGYIFETDAAGKFKIATDCVRASAIGGGCTLTQTAGQTAETTTYSRLVKEIGYPCTVSSYKSFGPDTKTGRELVELACSDHPDGAFAMLPVDKGQRGETFNCLRAESRQLKCTLTSAAATYAKLSAQMGAKGKTCQVSNGRGVGVAASGDDYVEVACSGSTGYMIQYGPGLEAVKAIIACKEAKGIGGGCKLGA